MDIRLSEKLIEEAKAILREHRGDISAVCIPSAGGEVSAVLSPNAEDMIPLTQIEYEGRTFYLGLPK